MRRLGVIAWAFIASASCGGGRLPLSPRVPASELHSRAVAALEEVIGSGPPEARVAAIALAERFDVAALFDPVTRLLDADDERVRAAAAAATLRGHPDAPHVLAAMLHARDPAARGIAVAALARRVGEPAAGDILAAFDDPDHGVREVAVASGGRFADPARLVRLAADHDGPVRAQALRALGQKKAREGAAPARAGLADAYLGARLAAADALFAIAGREAAADLAAATDPFVKLRAAVLVGDSRAGIREALMAPDPALRAAAANEVRGEVDLAQAAARDEQPGVRQAGARALLRAGARAEALPVLRQGLGEADPALRLAAAAELAAEGDPDGARVLAELARGPDAGQRAAALRALPRRGLIPDVIDGALGDPAAAVRVAAAEIVLERTP